MGTQTSVGPRAAAWTQRQAGVVRVVPRLPEPLAILEPRRPFEPAAAAFHRQRLDGLRLPRDVLLAVAVELEQQRWRDRVLQSSSSG